MKLDKDWFSQFKVVLGDEAHLFQAKSLQKIMEGLDECYYRHGFTGTLKSEESKTHRLVLEGCFAVSMMCWNRLNTEFQVKGGSASSARCLSRF